METISFDDAGDNKHDPGHQKGRGLDPMRSWFSPNYANTLLIGSKRNNLNNICSYTCIYCKTLIMSNRIHFLRSHVKRCNHFDKMKKEIVEDIGI